MKKISILGCGWLGLPLATILVKQGFLVAGSTMSKEKLSKLASLGISPFLLTLDANEVQGDLTSFLEKSEYLLLAIPPNLRGGLSDDFVGIIKNLVPFIENSSIKKVIFISSTSVYSETNETVTEESPINPVTESGKQLLETELFLQGNTNFETIILRFGGLIGDDRHPIYYLAGKSKIANPMAPVNLIHQEDCIGILMQLLTTNFWGETFNAVSPYHPSRELYYSDKAVAFGLELPTFDHEKPSVGKLISSEKIEKKLGYQFKKSSL